MKWDRERVADILNDLSITKAEGKDLDNCLKKIEDLLGSVRAEAIGWTWQQACQQYDQGRDPRRQEIPKLLEKSLADLNPDRG